ncbi:MAG: hypothetical protein U1C33_00055, partial [Candidatus Cloacimonadaceae bacterium]|nr:hypothetical protein [Candidatus Cloacimonadaceae bacterium]
VTNVEMIEPDLLAVGFELLQNGTVVGGANQPNRFYMLTGEGNTINIMQADLVPRNEIVDVFSHYPPPVGDPLFQNIIAVHDTIWTQMPPLTSTSLYFHNPIWIRGSFSGNYKIYSRGSIYILDDILLSGTPAGENPAQNTTDRVSLITEKQIIIKYGFRDPNDGLRYHPTCRSDAQGLYIYADLFAPNAGNGNPRTDGVFTYEYQHPHPSTPDYTHDGVLYTKIDLHRRAFPPNQNTSWPQLPAGSTHLNRAGLDYPWYNPLWPEREPYKERGTINLWGSVFQKRQGFLHRSSNDSEYPSHIGIWNIENDYCGTPTNVLWTEPIVDGGPSLSFGGINYPGASGAGTGYKKNFRFDGRTTPPSIKESLFGLGITIRGGTHSGFGTMAYIPQNVAVLHKSIDRLGDRFLFHLNNNVYLGLDNQCQLDIGENWQLAKLKLLPEDISIQLWET